MNYEVDDRYITIGEPRTIRFRLEDKATGEPVVNVPDVSVLYYRSDGRGRTTTAAKHVGDGVYAATLEANMVSTYYVYVAAPSKNLSFSDKSLLSLMARPAPQESKAESGN